MRSTPSALCSLVVAAVAALVLIGSASAEVAGIRTPDQLRPSAPGMYHVWSCRTPTGATATLDGWRDVPKSSCSSPGGSFGYAYGTGNPPSATGGAFSWDAAPDLEPISMDLLRTATVRSERGGVHGGAAISGGVMRPNASTGGADLLAYDELGSISLPGYTVGPSHQVMDPLSDHLPDGFDPVYIFGRCYGWDGTFDCLTSYSISTADARVRDGFTPTSSDRTGALINAMASPAAAQTGPLAFSLKTADRGSGMLQVVVEVDGKVSTTVSAAPAAPMCSPTAAADGLRGYIVQVPCPLTANVAGSWDATSVANGLHDVRVLVEDAAGNTSVAAGGKVLVDNPPPPPGGQTPGGQPSGGSTNPGAATASGSLSLTWPATERRASTKASVVSRCKGAAYAKKHPDDCVGRPAQSDLEQPWSSTASDTLQARVTAPDGTPRAGVQVRFVSESDAVGAKEQELTTIITGADGSAAISVPRDTGSRRLTARWFATPSDAVPVAQATATLSVGASTTLKAPRRVGRSAKVRFSGQVRGPADALGKVPLTLQVRNQGQWKTFETATSDASGRWSVSLRFAPRPGVYPVRVKVGTSPTFPFAEGFSAEARVRVR